MPSNLVWGDYAINDSERFLPFTIFIQYDSRSRQLKPDIGEINMNILATSPCLDTPDKRYLVRKFNPFLCAGLNQK